MSERQKYALYVAAGVFLGRVIYPSDLSLVDRLPIALWRAVVVGLLLVVIATSIDWFKKKK